MSETDKIKNTLRAEIKGIRKSINSEKKQILDRGVFENLMKCRKFLEADTVLVYMSTEIEVGTDAIIDYCLENEIRVALPRCFGGGVMKFYYYDGKSQLEKSKFGIYEPYEIAENEVMDFENTVCIVPALSFDSEGYRLGYGGGFYDRFLAKYEDIISVGICYEMNISEKLVRNDFDRKVNYVVTENKLEVCK